MNQYRQFDTTTAATVFNNSRGAVQTQSAGWVAGNPWLNAGTARVIVNQVNSQNPSLIRGTLEIAGSRADLIIANPAGLVFDGVNVLNASRTTFAAATPIFNGGNLDGYRVGAGLVVVNGGGLNDGQSDYSTVLARAVQLNAGVWAKQLKLVTGANQLDAGGTVTGPANATPSAAGYALDVAALGGMYAGKITLLGTEQGLGARNAGELIAQQAGLSLQTNGWLDNRGRIGSLGGGALTVASSGLSNTGTLAAEKDVQLSTGALQNPGLIQAGRQLRINATQVDNQTHGSLGGGRLQITATRLDNAGLLQQTGSQGLTLNAGTVHNTGTLGEQPDVGSGSVTGQSSGGTNATASQPANPSGSAATTAPSPASSTSTPSTVQPELLPDGEIIVTGVLNNGGSLLASGSMDLTTAQGLGNAGSMALRTLKVTGPLLDNTQGRLSVGNAQIQTGRFLNAGGQLAANGMLQLTTQQLDNAHGQLGSQSSLTLQTDLLHNQDGQIRAAQLVLQSGQLDNQRGLVLGQTLQADTAAVDNRQGLIAASGDLSLNTQGQRLLNTASGSDAGLLAGGKMTLLTGALSNEAGGRIQATTLSLQSGSLSNTDSGISAQQLAITSGALLNQRAAIQAAQQLEIDTQGASLRNLDSGLQGIVSGGSLTLHGDSLDNTAGYIGAKSAAQITTRTVLANQGQIVSEGSVSLTAGSLDNQQGRLQSVGAMTVLLGQGDLNNQQGLLQSGGVLHVTAGAVDNRATLAANTGIQAGRLDLRALSLNNAQGNTLTGNDATVSVRAGVSNDGGQIAAGGALGINATTTISQQGGSLVSGQDLTLTAAGLSGVGALSAGRDLTLAVQQDLAIQADVQAGRNLSISTPGRLDNQAAILAGGAALVQAHDIHNAAGGKISAGTLTMTVNDVLENRGLIDGGQVSVQAGNQILNIGTGRLYGDDIILGAARLDNLPEAGKAAAIAARHGLAIGVGQLNNGENGLLYSGGNLAIGGALNATGQVTGNAARVDNLSATIEAMGDLSISANVLHNERLRVAISQQKTVDETVMMSLPGWMHNGNNNDGLRESANYRAFEIYYLDPSDILSNDRYMTPDGVALGRAVVKLSPRTSSFFFAAGKMWGATGERDRLTQTEQTRTIYYLWRQDAQANPDQVPGGDDPFAEMTPKAGGGAPAFHYERDALTYSSQYGTCRNNCVQLVTPYQLTDPRHTIISPRGMNPSSENYNEHHRYSHHTAFEDILAPGAGAEASIRSGGRMSLQPGQSLENRYGQIAAGTDLLIDGAPAGQGSSKISNAGATLYRRHHFEVRSNTYSGVFYPNPQPDVNEELGSVGGSIQGNTLLSIQAGLIENLDQGRPASAPLPAPQTGALTANVAMGSDGVVHVQPPAGGPAGEVLTHTSSIRVPTSSLFSIVPDGPSALVQTDPAFTQKSAWLNSDYLLSGQPVNPASTLKRLGDGYYEQQLIREQVAQLTGRRFLSGYASDEAQYRALMESGRTFAASHQLTPGVALTAAQMAQLTSDIVWLVKQTVTLPNGQQQDVLVPQVYVKLQPGDLGHDGAILAADQVNLRLNGNLDNQGSIAGRKVLAINAESLGNLGGRLQGQEIALSARTDIDNLGGAIQAGSSLTMVAGRDINVVSTRASEEKVDGNALLQKTSLDRIASLYVGGGAGQMQLVAGRDLTLAAAQIQNQADDGHTQLQSGQDLKVGTVETRRQDNLYVSSNNWIRRGSEDDVGSRIQTQGDLALISGRDIQAAAADISSNRGQLALQAVRDLTLDSGQEVHQLDWQTHDTHKGRLSSKTVDGRYHDLQTLAKVTSLSGRTVTGSAGGDMTLIGSQVVSDQGTVLKAGNNLTLKEARNTDEYFNHHVEKKSGLMSSGGLGFSFGSREMGKDDTTRINQAVGSTVGAISGDVTLLAGQRYTQTGSAVTATGVNGGGDVNIVAKDIAITEARETAQNVTDTWFKQSGVTLAITNPVLNAIQTIDQLSKAASKTSDSRMKTLAAASAGMSAYSAYKAVDAGQGQTIDGKANQIATSEGGKPGSRDATAADKGGGFGISISVGSSSNKSHSESSSDTSVASRIDAAGSINLVATGGDKNSNILIQGSDLKAAKDIALAADNQIQLLASQDRSEQHSQNSGRNGSVGIGLQFGGSGSGLMLNVSASRSRGHADGDSVAYNNSHLNAGENVSLSSGGDATLKGAVVAGKAVSANIGGHLAIESLQDKTHYDSAQQSLGGSVSVGFGVPGGSLSYAKSKVNSDFLSVGEQSGLLAGDGGFDIRVAGDTTLKGGVITSTEAALQAQNNGFETGGKLAMSDLHNHAEYDASSVSVSVGTSISSSGAWTPSGSGMGFGNDSGSADSETRSGISGIAGNQNARTGDAQTGLKPIFDADKVQQDIDAQTLITQSFGQQASKLVGDYASGKMSEANTLQAQAIVARRNGHETEADQLDTQAEQITDQWGDNGTARIALHTAIGGLTGGMAGAAGSLTGTISAAQTANLLESAGITQKNNPALYNSLVGLAGTTAGAMVGGVTGAGTAFNEAANNKLLHDEQLSAIKRLAHGDKKKEDRFFAAACFMIKCSAEFVSGSREYAIFTELERQGAKYIDERRQLKGYSYTELQPSPSGYPAIGNRVTHKDLFNYSNEDQANDGMTLARNYRIRQFQKSGMSLTAAKLAVAGVDFSMLMLGTIGGRSLGKIPLASLSQEEQIALRAAELQSAEKLADVPGRVRSRINLTNGGIDHLSSRHLSDTSSASQFSISKSEVIDLLKSKNAVKTPVTRIVESEGGAKFVREFDVGRTIGFDKHNGGKATSIMTIMTDRFGNLVSSYPGVLK